MMRKALAVICVLLVSACNEAAPEQKESFDRTLLLENYANEFILDGFNELNIKTQTLDGIIQSASQLSDLQAARNAWKEAYLSFLNVTLYNFGPAGEESLRKTMVEEIGLFPVNAAKIEERITQGNYSTQDFDRDARGFLGLEYLLYAGGASHFGQRLEYLKAVSSHLAGEVNRMSSEWGTFKTDFVANDGTAAGSSTSVMYNEFVKSFEALKNFKVGLPLGLRPGQEAALPQNVESYFAGFSKDFALAHFQSIKSNWYGSNGRGFKDYLMTVEGGEELVVRTEAQMLEVEVAFEAVSNEDFHPENINENQALIALHTELQRMTRYFKSEMSSVLGIAITFNSGDGD